MSPEVARPRYNGGRTLQRRVFTPPARLLVKLGVSPDAVTIAGTVIVIAASLWLYPTGHLLAATLVIAVVAFADSLDGTMARLAGRSSQWGAFLDSTLDRLADGAIFSGIALYFFGKGSDFFSGTAALACVVFAFAVSYARSRAEATGFDAHVGLAERTPRLVVALIGVFAVAVGAPTWVGGIVLTVVAVASAITAGQRIAAVYRQSRQSGEARHPSPPGQSSPPRHPSQPGQPRSEENA